MNPIVTTRHVSTTTHPAISEALNYLAGRCNYASTRDGVGFNGAHTEWGHRLADSLPDLTREQQIRAIEMLRIYQKTQLTPAGIELPTDLELAAFLRENTPKPVKRSAEIPEVLPGLTPNAQQWQALQEMEGFLAGQERFYLLTGFAGSGKTSIIQALIKRLRDKGDRRPIVFTAFSNKATKVLAKMVDRWSLGIDCMTCCKLLGLKPEIDLKTGKQYFKPDYESENQIENYSLVVVDEASMISKEMWGLLTEAVSGLFNKTQLLFVGDVAQLPPVNERESECFTQIFNSSHLTEVVRYGGSIGVLAESIRNRLQYKELPKFQTDTNDDRTEGTFVLSLHDWESALVRAFTSQSYQNDPDYVRALAYTNKRVNSLNQKVRAAIYGESAPRFAIGERLMANSPVLIGDTIALQTSAECEVLEVTEGRSGEWQVWFLGVRTDEGKHKLVSVLHEGDRVKFAEKLEGYAKEKRWREYWDLKMLFADLNYAYSLTIHKSQGSTFQNVFIDIPNILTNQNVQERNQLAYVGVTRAAKRLFIYGGR